MDTDSSKKTGNKLLGTVLLLITTLIWGFAFVSQVNSADSISPMIFNGIRFLLGAVCLFPVVLILKRKEFRRIDWRSAIRSALIGGMILMIASTFQQYGCLFTRSSGISGFITGMYTVLTPIVCFILYKRSPRFNVWLGFGIAVVGLFLLSFMGVESASDGEINGYVNPPIGIIMLCVASVFYTAQVMFIDHTVEKNDPLIYSLGEFIVCGAVSLILGIIIESRGITINGAQIVSAFTLGCVKNSAFDILYCGIFSVGVAYTLQTVGQKMVDATHAAIIFTTEPLFSAVFGAVFGIDKFTPWGYTGCAVILAGIILTQLVFRKKKNT